MKFVFIIIMFENIAALCIIILKTIDNLLHHTFSETPKVYIYLIVILVLTIISVVAYAA